MNSNYHGDKIINLNENIQRVELLHMEEYCNSLKKSNLTSVTSIYNKFAEVIGQHEFIVKVYFTWSLNY